MTRDAVFYLDPIRDTPLNVFSRLREAVRTSSQRQASPAQWAGFIKSLTQKGIKQSEIDDVGIIDWLQKQNDAKITKENLLLQIERQTPRIKVVDLAKPQFSSYRSISGNYCERLYILSSESMQIDDMIEDFFYKIEELGFDPSPLIEDPGLVDKLEAELNRLKSLRPKSWDFANHHFSKSIKTHGKNLLAHARFIRKDGLFFIQEIQSDWAQKGRRFNWNGNFPRAPFVTNTEQWAGLVLKELLQFAAHDPATQRVAWIRSNMRNGWNHDQERDNLAEFYDNIVRRITEKLLAKTDTRVQTMLVDDMHGQQHEVLGFEMTPKARETLGAAFPLYSRGELLGHQHRNHDDDDESEVKARVLQECTHMLGSAHMVRFFNRIYDIAQGKEVAGRYWNSAIEISLRARDPLSVARHEAMHFAYDHLLLAHERLVLDMAFFPGSDLARRTQEVLRQRGLHDAARECENPKECAAYAFELWCRRELDIHEEPRNVFEAVVHALIEIGNWIRKMVRPQEGQTAHEIFENLRRGIIAQRELIKQRLLEADSETEAATATAR